MNPGRKQPYSCGFLYTLLAKSVGIPLRELFTSAGSVVRAYRRAQKALSSPALRDALWEQLQHPGAAPLGYGHVAWERKSISPIAIQIRVTVPPGRGAGLGETVT
ncbi:MAG: hypothetical protein IT210_11425 [Armatimonadetes bacterium]|nr:hypothetical protein [Armatimonadota bacterium]